MPSRARANACARFINAALDARGHLHARHHRGHQPRRAVLRAAALQRGDEILLTALEHHANIVPWQLVVRADRRACCKVAPIDRRGELRLRRVRARCCRPRTRIVAMRARLERARHHPAGARDRRRSRTRAARWCWSTARRPCRTRASTCRRSTATSTPSPPQDVRPHRHRRAVRARSAARGHAAVAGRRRHDPHRELREDHVQRPAVQVRGRHAQHLRRGRPGRGHRLRRQRSASTPSPPTSSGCSSSRPRELAADSGPQHHRHRAAHKAAVISFTIDGIHPHDLGTILDAEGVAVRTGHHCAMPVMDFFERAGDGARLVRLLQHANPTSTRWSRRCARRARCSADGPQGPLSRRDPRSQQASRATSARSIRRDARADGHNPLCGDRLHRRRCGSTATASRTCASKARAARSPWPPRR